MLKAIYGINSFIIIYDVSYKPFFAVPQLEKRQINSVNYLVTDSDVIILLNSCVDIPVD